MLNYATRLLKLMLLLENVIFVSNVVCRCSRSIYAMYNEFLSSFFTYCVTLLIFAKCDISMPVNFLNFCILKLTLFMQTLESAGI